MIALKNLTIGFDHELFSVHDFNFEIGRVYSILGRNGIGKSTLLRAIAGLNSPLKGSVLIENNDIVSMSGKAVAQKIAFVNSNPLGVSHLPVDEFLLLGRSNFTSIWGAYSKDDLDILAHTKMLFQIEHLGMKYTNQLSTGELQLCAIAKAFIQGSDMILLDEPTSALDYSNKRKIYDLLLRQASEYKKGIILTTHDIELAFKYAFKFLLINSRSKTLEKISSFSEAEKEFLI